MENFRRAIGLRIKEVKEVYEGEVGRCCNTLYGGHLGWRVSGLCLGLLS
jgi:hypothetical protein